MKTRDKHFTLLSIDYVSYYYIIQYYYTIRVDLIELEPFHCSVLLII